MKIVSLSKDVDHRFSKQTCDELHFITGQGVEGDAHCGVTVKHRSRVKKDPTQPNLRQVHLIHFELLEELTAQGFTVAAGSLGENILTVGIDLLALPEGTTLKIGDEVILQVTGLRNPCLQLDKFQPGLTRAVLELDDAGDLVRKAGIMAIVLQGGATRVGDPIGITLPNAPFRKLEVV